MYKKDKIIIEIDDTDNFTEIKHIINRHCEFQKDKFTYSNIQCKCNKENRANLVLKFNDRHTLKDLINELYELCKYVTFKDIDSKEVLPYTGRIIIRFDKNKSIKIGTMDKLDELKVLKTEFGYCEGYKPLLQNVDGCSPVINTEEIYLVSDSLDNLIKLDSIIQNKLLEFDPNLELDFEFD